MTLCFLSPVAQSAELSHLACQVQNGKQVHGVVYVEKKPKYTMISGEWTFLEDDPAATVAEYPLYAADLSKLMDKLMRQ